MRRQRCHCRGKGRAVAAAHAAFDDGQQLVVDTGDQPLIIETSGDDLGPDQATLRIDLARLVLGA